jgi:hypothetical protein
VTSHDDQFLPEMNAEESVLEFATASFKSVWALELLLALKRGRDRVWRADDMIVELRGSRGVVSEALNNLVAAGLAVEENEGAYRYRAGSPAIDQLVDELEQLYAVKPTVVMRSIVTSSNLKLQILSDAFRIKE